MLCEETGENAGDGRMSVAFKTLGCRMNRAEAAVFAAQFAAAGFRLADDGEPADVVVLHSCAVTRAAERETFRLLRAWRRDPATAKALVVATGCAVACNRPELLLEAGADMVVPKAGQGTLAEAVAARLNRRVEAPSPRPPLFTTKRALLKVQDGCAFDCAYCIVPKTRGAPVSRPWREALGEAEALLDAGFKEIVLTGCNLACYGDGGRGLPELADAVCALAGERGARVRLGSVEPGLRDDEIVDVMRARRNLCRFLHLPIQCGDTPVLRAMGRRYTAESVAGFLARATAALPLLGLGADFITGLPGEDDAAFERSCDLVRRFPFVHIHVFPFSPRPGTRAAGMAGCPPRAVAKARAARLRRAGEESAEAYLRGLVGHEVQVLVEGRSRDGLAHGWSEGHAPCVFPSDAPVASLTSFTPGRVAGGALRA